MGQQCGHIRKDNFQFCVGRHSSFDLPLFEHLVGNVDLVEVLMLRLFELHDLNKNGLLEEAELIQLNKKIAMLHYGKDTDKEKVRTKYQNLFRTELNPEGKPVNYDTFREYIIKVLSEMTADNPVEQQMILEQFIVEAVQARIAFHDPSLESANDAPFVKTISFDEAAAMERWVSHPAHRAPPVAAEAPRLHAWCSEDEMLTMASTSASPRDSSASSPDSSSGGQSSSEPGSPVSTTASPPGSPCTATASSQVEDPCGVTSRFEAVLAALPLCQLEAHVALLPDLPNALAQWGGRRCAHTRRHGTSFLFCLDEDEDGEAEAEASESKDGCRKRFMSVCSNDSGTPTTVGGSPLASPR